MQASYRQKRKFMPRAVCCCLQTCNRGFVMRVIWCTSVPSFICRKASYVISGWRKGAGLGRGFTEIA